MQRDRPSTQMLCDKQEAVKHSQRLGGHSIYAVFYYFKKVVVYIGPPSNVKGSFIQVIFQVCFYVAIHQQKFKGFPTVFVSCSNM